jgi:hypothetical protein
MNLVNLTRHPADVTIATDKDGREHVLVVAKATFEVRDDGSCALAAKQQPMTYADEAFGEPGLSSVRYESDFALRKRRCDVVMNAHAHAPGGTPAAEVDVGLLFGPILKTARVFGDRIWKPRLLAGFAPSDPVPFKKLPIRYERAFGGADRSHPDEKKHVVDERNTVGRGLYVRNESAHGGVLPNVENPRGLVASPFDRPAPVGFGFLARHVPPRRGYAGTYDEKWKEERFPFLPADFDDRYFQGAPEDQQCDYPKGGESVAVLGATPSGKWGFRLPALDVPARLIGLDRRIEFRCVVDTVILEPEENRFMLVARGSCPLRWKPSRIQEIWVGNPSPARVKAHRKSKEYKVWARARR